MPWRDSMEPVRMRRVALLAPRDRLRDLLVEVAAHGVVELDPATDADPGEASRLLAVIPHADDVVPLLDRAAPDLTAAAAAGRVDLLAGEAEVERRAAAAVTRDRVAAVAGWMPADEIESLAAAVAPVGGAVTVLPSPRGVDPPTLVHGHGGLNRSFAPLMDTYATVPYADVDPTVLAGLAFVVMFGMMFADAGQGALLLALGIVLRSGRARRLAAFRPAWPFVVGAAASAIVFGVLFGEFFGPTGVLPVRWLTPLEEPVLLLEVAVGVGAVLLSLAYVVGIVNRWREGGWRYALVATSGIAGFALFLGLGAVALGAYTALPWLTWSGVAVAVVGLALAYLGFLAAAGGGAAGVTQAVVEVFDGVLRLGTNVVSFARLGAFGLAHAALGAIVWQGTTALWAVGTLLAGLAAVGLFLVGNALTFTLEAVVAGVQALRLEYYELFSRVFVSEGRPFRPWHVPVSEEAAAWPSG